MTEIPQRLRKDAIVEALFELRFASREFPEVLVGKLVSALGDGMAIERLPMADLPPPMRKADPNFAFLPTLQLKKENRLIRLGDQVVSWHVLPPYPGWENWIKEVSPTVDAACAILRTGFPTRLGLRYINILNKTDHHVSGIAAMNLSIEVNGRSLSDVNLNYKVVRRGQSVTVKIASPEFVQGPPRGFSLVIDIDVNTEGSGGPPAGWEGVQKWIEDAHTTLKEEFFTLWKPEQLRLLVEE
jgi:uncharacterized protein (TIGR04255 family)